MLKNVEMINLGGKVIKCAIDTQQMRIEYTKGKFIK